MNVQMEQTPTVVMATQHAPIIMAHMIVCVMKDILVMASHAKILMSATQTGIHVIRMPPVQTLKDHTRVFVMMDSLEMDIIVQT